MAAMACWLHTCFWLAWSHFFSIGIGMFAPLPESGSLTAAFPLLDGHHMPVLGLGVFKMKQGAETVHAVAAALEAGYRMIDTASFYDNEESVGQAMKESGVPRSEIYLETKLWDSDHGYEAAHAAVRLSLKKLGVDYIDLYLVHSPSTGKLVETWDALVEMKHMGIVKSIGVSNYGVAHLEALESHKRPLPVVNQVEAHPLNWKSRKPLFEWCSQRGIIVQAYGSVLAGRNEVLGNSVIQGIAKTTEKTPQQVLLRWGHQMGFQIIPKSSKKERILTNSQIFDFELNNDDMQALSSMEGHLGAYWDPLNVPVDLGNLSAASRPQEEL